MKRLEREGSVETILSRNAFILTQFFVWKMFYTISSRTKLTNLKGGKNMKGKNCMALICISFILLSSYDELSPVAYAQDSILCIGYSNIFSDYMTRYMTSEQVGNAYGLNITETSSATYYEYEEFGLATAYWGFRAWKAFSNGSEQYITPSGQSKAVVQRSSAGRGIQSNTWTLSDIVDYQDCSIVVGIYFGFTSNPDLNIVNFTTGPLGSGAIHNSTWNVSYYTRISRTAGGYYDYVFQWGSSYYCSRIENFEIEEYWVKAENHIRMYERGWEWRVPYLDGYYWQSLAIFNDDSWNTCFEGGLLCHYTRDWTGTWVWIWHYYMTYWVGGNENSVTQSAPFDYFPGSEFTVTLWRNPSDSTIWNVNFYSPDNSLNVTWSNQYTFTWHGVVFGSETESWTEPLSGQNTYEIGESDHVQVYDSNNVMTPLTNKHLVYSLPPFQYVNATWDSPFNSFYTWINH